ncbi:hypothetical protein BJ742DRAFT_842795 [Cladochytrium replicatum]|nr:hypothetical protein BJ742DRAFT_842795 [Cladochytrium replicatum]
MNSCLGQLRIQTQPLVRAYIHIFIYFLFLFLCFRKGGYVCVLCVCDVVNNWALNDFLSAASTDSMLTSEFSMFDTADGDSTFMDSWYAAMGLGDTSTSSPTDTVPFLPSPNDTFTEPASSSSPASLMTSTSDTFLIASNEFESKAFSMPVVVPPTMTMAISAAGATNFFPEMGMATSIIVPQTSSFIKKEPVFNFGSAIPTKVFGDEPAHNSRIPTRSVMTNSSLPQEPAQQPPTVATKKSTRSTKSKPANITTTAVGTASSSSKPASTSPSRKRSRPSTASRSASPHQSTSDDEVSVPADEEEDEVVRKRQRNTEAARRSRQRKVMKMTSLEQRVKELQGENSRLGLRLAVLESERIGWVAKEAELAGKVRRLEAQLAEAHGAIMRLGGRNGASGSDVVLPVRTMGGRV